MCETLGPEVGGSWLTAIGGKELWRCAEQLRQQTDGGDSGDRLDCWHGRDMTVEISISSVTEMQLRISPRGEKRAEFPRCFLENVDLILADTSGKMDGEALWFRN